MRRGVDRGHAAGGQGPLLTRLSTQIANLNTRSRRRSAANAPRLRTSSRACSAPSAPAAVAGVPWQPHRPPPAGGGSVVNRCGGGWRPWQTRRPPPNTGHRSTTHLIGSPRRFAADLLASRDCRGGPSTGRGCFWPHPRRAAGRRRSSGVSLAGRPMVVGRIEYCRYIGVSSNACG